MCSQIQKENLHQASSGHMQQLLLTDCIPTVYSVLAQNISHTVIAVGRNAKVPQRRFHALAQGLLAPVAAVKPPLELPICLAYFERECLAIPQLPTNTSWPATPVHSITLTHGRPRRNPKSRPSLLTLPDRILLMKGRQSPTPP